MGRNPREFTYPWRDGERSSIQQPSHCLQCEQRCCSFARLLHTQVLKGHTCGKIRVLQLYLGKKCAMPLKCLRLLPLPGNQLLNTDYMFKLMLIFGLFTWFLRCSLHPLLLWPLSHLPLSLSSPFPGFSSPTSSLSEAPRLLSTVSSRSV